MTSQKRLIALVCAVLLAVSAIIYAMSPYERRYTSNSSEYMQKLAELSPHESEWIAENMFFLPVDGNVNIIVGRRFPNTNYLVIFGKTSLANKSFDEAFEWAVSHRMEFRQEWTGRDAVWIFYKPSRLYNIIHVQKSTGVFRVAIGCDVEP